MQYRVGYPSSPTINIKGSSKHQRQPEQNQSLDLIFPLSTESWGKVCCTLLFCCSQQNYEYWIIQNCPSLWLSVQSTRLTMLSKSLWQVDCAPPTPSGRTSRKYAHIVPVFKKGDEANPANYRRISLTSVCSKITEHVVHGSIMKHLQHYNILSDQQPVPSVKLCPVRRSCWWPSMTLLKVSTK